MYTYKCICSRPCAALNQFPKVFLRFVVMSRVNWMLHTFRRAVKMCVCVCVYVRIWSCSAPRYSFPGSAVIEYASWSDTVDATTRPHNHEPYNPLARRLGDTLGIIDVGGGKHVTAFCGAWWESLAVSATMKRVHMPTHILMRTSMYMVVEWAPHKSAGPTHVVAFKCQIRAADELTRTPTAHDSHL